MSKLQRIVMVLLLLVALAISANAETSASVIDEDLALSCLLYSTAEIQNWGVQDGVQNISLTGTWEAPAGKLFTIKSEAGKYSYRLDYGQGWHNDFSFTVKGNKLMIFDQIPALRSTKSPSVPTHGDFLACLVQPDTYPEYLMLIFSKKGSDLVLTPVSDNKVVTVITIQQKDDQVLLLDKDGNTVYSLKRAYPGEQPATDAWKPLRDFSLVLLNDMADNTQAYAKKHNGKCPAMNDLSKLSDAIQGLFCQPATYEPYKFNSALSSIKISSIKNPGNVVLYYDPKPWPDGSRCVVFTSALSGSSEPKLVTATEWAKLAKANHLE